jgi:Ca-activated chloride channel family protein
MQYLEFKNPWLLLLLLPYLAMAAVFIGNRLYARESAIAVSAEGVVKKRGTVRSATYRFLPILRFLSILFLIIAVARPGRGVSYSSIKNLGIDIMIALDVSGSMSNEDFQPKNRLTVAKKVLKDFISIRKSDRIGLIVFANDAYLQCPLTVEHNIIHDIVDDIDFGIVDHRRTAIGDAVALATSRMMDLKSKSRMILLLTDGANNAGIIDPQTAAKASAELGIKIYTVGIGKKEYLRSDIFGNRRLVKSELDIEALQKISDITGGKFYNATSGGVLWQNIQDIDRLERSEADLRVYHEFFDKFQIFLIISISLFFLEVMLRSVFYRKIP